MTFKPSHGIDPTWYGLSETLDRNAATDFLALAKRVELFERDSLNLMISGCEWFAWSLPPEDPRAKTDLNHIFSRYCLFIGTLALIYFDESKERKLVDEVDLRILIGEMFNIGGLEPDSKWFLDHELDPLQSRLNELVQENSYLAKIDPKDTKILSSLLLMSRTAVIQWEGLSFSADDWIRSIVLYEKYRRIAVAKGFCSAQELEVAERQFLGTTRQNLMKSAMLLIGLFSSSITDKSKPPGSLDPKTYTLPKEIEEKFAIDTSDLEIIVDRLSLRASELPKRKDDLEKIPPKAWLCAKELWALHDRPLVRIDDKDPGRLVMCLSPQRLLPKCAKLFQHEIVSFYEVNNVFKCKQRAFDLRGVALEEYIDEVSVGTSLQKVDPLLPADYKGKKPDFLWIGDEWTILIEVKSNIKMNSDQTFFNSASLIDTWKNLTEPIDQAKGAIDVGLVKTKKCCLIVVTNDNISEPSTNFKRVAKHWDFLNGTKIDCLAILSLSQIETAIHCHTPDKVGKNIQSTWEALNPLSVHDSLLDYDFFDAQQMPRQQVLHLENKWKELFPALERPKC